MMQPNSGLLVTDRFGQPRRLDLFDAPMRKGQIYNRNGVFVGPSGTGKSFTMNAILYYAAIQGAHITIVDIGHSYKRLGESLGAKYIAHSDENPIALNPFYFQNPAQVNTEFKNVIVQVLRMLYKKTADALRKSEDVALAELVNAYYTFCFAHPAIYPNFNSLFEFVDTDFREIFEKDLKGRAEQEFDIDHFIFNIRPFYKGKKFDFLLNAPLKEDLSQHPLLIYDLDNLRDHEILLPIVTLLITHTYINQLFQLRNTLKILIIEEAWKAIANPAFAEFLLWGFKTARKHGGSICVVTQDIEDLKKSDTIGNAILANTDIKIFMELRNYQENVTEIMELFKIAREDVPLLLSINKPILPRLAYKEMAVILGGKCKIYGIEVSREAYALFTTTASEVDQIKTIAETQDISLKDAAIAWAQLPQHFK